MVKSSILILRYGEHIDFFGSYLHLFVFMKLHHPIEPESSIDLGNHNCEKIINSFPLFGSKGLSGDESAFGNHKHSEVAAGRKLSSKP